MVRHRFTQISAALLLLTGLMFADGGLYCGDKVVSFDKLTTKPAVLERGEVVYPEAAKQDSLEGKVVLRVLVDATGNVTEVEIVKSNPSFDQAAIDAAKKFRFSPGKVDEEAVAVWLSIPFSFKLG